MTIPMQVPSGFFKTKHVLHAHAVELLRQSYNRFVQSVADGKPAAMVLEEGVEFVPLQTNVVPDAICRYCTVPNLSSAAWCTQCGAPLIH